MRAFLILPAAKYYESDLIKEGGMGGACGTYVG